VQPRQLLDLYIPEGAVPGGPPVPVVVFVTGGAWTIGYKAWGATLAWRLCGAGVMVCALDYRNFPQGSAMQVGGPGGVEGAVVETGRQITRMSAHAKPRQHATQHQRSVPRLISLSVSLALKPISSLCPPIHLPMQPDAGGHQHRGLLGDTQD
jgi:hypothetical protein